MTLREKGESDSQESQTLILKPMARYQPHMRLRILRLLGNMRLTFLKGASKSVTTLIPPNAEKRSTAQTQTTSVPKDGSRPPPKQATAKTESSGVKSHRTAKPAMTKSDRPGRQHNPASRVSHAWNLLLNWFSAPGALAAWDDISPSSSWIR